MTSALWMLYLADVTDGVRLCLILSGVACAGYGGFRGFFALTEDELVPASVKPALIIAVSCALVAALIPSKTTLYAIAAVNVGQTALHTPTGDKAMRALNSWLDRQIDGEKK